jgi:hypothetical protein
MWLQFIVGYHCVEFLVSGSVCWGSAVEGPTLFFLLLFVLRVFVGNPGLLVNPLYFTCLPFFRHPFYLVKYMHVKSCSQKKKTSA